MDNYENDRCPICGYYIDPPAEHPALGCQCRFTGDAHPNRYKRQEVVLHHLYLISEKQLQHIINLEKFWQIDYDDDERRGILQCLKAAAKLYKEKNK